MATSNKVMSDAMRGGRDKLNSYMFGGEEGSEPSDTPAEEGAEITVLGPDDPDDPTMYTYEPVGNGAWMVYPPGVPCETGSDRIEMDHPADASEFATMQSRLDTSAGTGTTPDSTSAGAGTGGTGELPG